MLAHLFPPPPHPTCCLQAAPAKKEAAKPAPKPAPKKAEAAKPAPKAEAAKPAPKAKAAKPALKAKAAKPTPKKAKVATPKGKTTKPAVKVRGQGRAAGPQGGSAAPACIIGGMRIAQRQMSTSRPLSISPALSTERHQEPGRPNAGRSPPLATLALRLNGSLPSPPTRLPSRRRLLPRPSQ